MLAQATTGFAEFVPTIGVLAATVTAIVVLRLVLRRRAADGGGETRWQAQAGTVLLAALGLLGVLLTLPAGGLDKQTILGVLGLALTAVIALSASTLVANAMAGMMLHSVGNFRPGDYVRVGEHFGRVTERGLFHTELQTEDGDLTTLPNNLLVNNAVTVVRSTGTVISCSVSLGYDVPRPDVEVLLVEAAEAAGLEEPFVHVTELGDFAVTYRVAGFLTEVRQMLATRSRLRAAVMDALHGAGIEIVSPHFMNQRRLDPALRFIPRTGSRVAPGPVDEVPQELVFEKAERAGRLEELRDRRAQIQGDLSQLDDQLKAGEVDQDRYQRRQAAAARLLEHIDYLIDTLDDNRGPS